MKIKVSNYIAKRLTELGIERVFTVTGGGAMHLNDALGHQEGLQCLYNHHEQASAIAAEAYARIDNKIAALCVTTGPGGTNAITGVVGGWLDSIPMLVLSGQVRYDTTARWTGLDIRAMGDQEFEITKAISCMTKYSEMVIEPMRIRYCLEKAFYLAQSGRPGPTWLDIPVDVQGAYVESDDLTGFDEQDYLSGGTGWCGGLGQWTIAADYAGQGEPRPCVPKLVDESVVRSVLERIRAAKRPVFYVGNGVRIAGAHELFMQVVKRLGIPVVTCWNSQDAIATDDPLHVGQAGGMGDRPGNFAIQNSDLVFAVGSRLSIRQVGYNYQTWAREAYVIVNDVDAEELKKPSVHYDMKIHADASDLLAMLLAILELEYKDKIPVFGGGEGLPGQTWLETCQMWKDRYPVVLPKHLDTTDQAPANVYAFVHELSSRLAEGQITVVGNGSACVVGGHAYRIKAGQRFITNSAIAAMGYDLPAAIGACLAVRDRQNQAGQKAHPGCQQDLILLTGDGSIQMNLQELQTIIHHQLPIKIFLINNGGYHSIRQTQKNYFGEPLVGVGTDSCDLSFPDMAKLAAAYGFPYLAAHYNEELGEVVAQTLAITGPAICEAFVTIDQLFEPKSAAKRLPDGTMVSPPLEDLSPFLSEDEMDEMMIIPRLQSHTKKSGE